MPLLWRVFAVNALVLVGAAAALTLSPATVSFPVALTELLMLAVGLCLLLAINLLLLRRVFRPLRSLREVMARVDPLRLGARVAVTGADVEVKALAAAFNEMLGRLERERRDSGRRALAAQEEERRRIARELHDEVGQELTAAVLQLDRAADGDAALLESREAVRATLLEVREIARRLRPEELDELGLRSALTALCSEFGRRTGIRVERHMARDLRQLAADEELVVYRVAQESLTNVARHAEATTVLVGSRPSWTERSRCGSAITAAAYLPSWVKGMGSAVCESALCWSERRSSSAALQKGAPRSRCICRREAGALDRAAEDKGACR